MCVGDKILKHLDFFIVFLSFSLNFDKEKWCYMYIKQFLRK